MADKKTEKWNGPMQFNVMLETPTKFDAPAKDRLTPEQAQKFFYFFCVAMVEQDFQRHLERSNA